jgi:hypothetical protein
VTQTHVHVFRETTLDDPEDEWSLWFQWCRWNFPDGSAQHGYRYIWKNRGRLMPQRGQARIPSWDVQKKMHEQAVAEGWGSYADEQFDALPAVPVTRTPDFAAEAARQARLLAEWEASPVGREEMAFWDALVREAWDEETD